MISLSSQLLELYLKLGAGVSLGWFLGKKLPSVAPVKIGKFLFLIGVPIGIVAFLRRADLSGAIWLAPVIAWSAIFSGAFLSWLWLKLRVGEEEKSSWSKPSQGSFILASMVGNTGYLGFPIILTLFGEKYFGWALFYDLLGTTIGIYGLGALMGAYFGKGAQDSQQLILTLLKTPALWALCFGLWFRSIPLPQPLEISLQTFAWTVISLSLVLIGMRLSQIDSWLSLQTASITLGIKMLLIPLILGLIIFQFGVHGVPHLVLVLQMSMPPAFGTLVLAENFDLDRQLAVTALVVGCGSLLLMLPVWLLLFGSMDGAFTISWGF